MSLTLLVLFRALIFLVLIVKRAGSMYVGSIIFVSAYLLLIWEIMLREGKQRDLAAIPWWYYHE